MDMKKIRVILDTNVLYAGLYSSRGASHQILRALQRGRVEIVISTALLFEYEYILKRNKIELELSDRDIEKVLDNLCRLGEYQKIYFLWRPYLSDSKDDHILEVAVASGTKTILTHTVKDFKGSEKFGIRVITPRKLLEEIK